MRGDIYIDSRSPHFFFFITLEFKVLNFYSDTSMMVIIPYLTLTAFVHLTLASQNQIPLKPTAVSTIPLLGFGTWNLKESNNSNAVSLAIQTGYRHIDCAAIYGNEKEVGKGIADGLKKARLERSDIWITSKLWNDQ